MSLDVNVIEMKLRDHHGVRGALLQSVVSELRRAKTLEILNGCLEDRIAFLERHVPPEIAKPKAEPYCGNYIKFTGD